MYYLLYSFFYLLSLLPMRVLYVLSDIIYLYVYYIHGYRKTVVMENLKIAFPGKTEKERVAIAKKFYHNLLDSFIETIKLASASRKFLQKRVTANWEILQQLFDSGKRCQLHLGHTFNWEWGHHTLSMNTPFQVLVVYMPISNAAFEKLMYKLRTKFGSHFIPATKMSESMIAYSNTQYLLGLVADQNPGKPESAWWLSFFNRPTAFVPGPEKGARDRNIPVLFASIEKTKRGHYHSTLEIVTENPAYLEEGELTLRYAHFMEALIQRNPEMWLWSHRRWKHAWKPEFASQWTGPHNSV